MIQFLLFLAIIIGAIMFIKYKVTSLYNVLKNVVVSTFSSHVDVKLKTKNRDYSPQVTVTEFTRNQALPKIGVFAPDVTVSFNTYFDTIIKYGNSTGTVSTVDLAGVIVKILTDHPGNESYRGADAIMIKFFEQYKDISISLPLIEMLYAIKAGITNYD